MGTKVKNMDVVISNGAWASSYGTFHSWRTVIADKIGINLNKMEGFEGGYIEWNSLDPHPLHKLLNHADDQGDIKWKDCRVIADELYKLLPYMEAYVDRTRAFIGAAKRAYAQKQNLKFK